MFFYRPYHTTDKKLLHELYNKNVIHDGFYKELSYQEFDENLFSHPEFDRSGCYICISHNQIIGFIECFIRKIDTSDSSKPGYISTILVDYNYRKKGIGTHLLKLATSYIKSRGHNQLMISYEGTMNWPWYIEGTNKHDHAGAPGLLLDSDFMMFFKKMGFRVDDTLDAFHLNLSEFKPQERVKQDLEKAKKDGITIELYDKEKHTGLHEFYLDINRECFIRVIENNLKLPKPYPFAVIVKDNKIMGWTGAFYTEASGRAHFDGIIISEKVRKRGLGRALFSYLAEYSYAHGSTYMSFFTQRDNIARNIYLGLGFKIVKTFQTLKKEI